MQRKVTMIVKAHVPGDDPRPKTRAAEVEAEQAVTDYSARIEALIRAHTGIDEFTADPVSAQDAYSWRNRHPQRTFTYQLQVTIEGDNGYPESGKRVNKFFDDLGDKIVQLRGADKDVDFTSHAL
jgi:hypothetical protein